MVPRVECVEGFREGKAKTGGVEGELLPASPGYLCLALLCTRGTARGFKRQKGGNIRLS